jgi:hypothetical protein
MPNLEPARPRRAPRATALLCLACAVAAVAGAARAAGDEARLDFAPLAAARAGDAIEYRIASTTPGGVDVGNDRFEARSVSETVLVVGTDPSGKVVCERRLRRDERDARALAAAFGMDVPASATVTVTREASFALDDRPFAAERVHAAWSDDDDDFEVDFWFAREVPVAGLALARSLGRERGEAAWTRVTSIVPVAMKRAEAK